MREDRTLLDRQAVARRLNISVEVLYRRVAQLYADGFPRPALGQMSGARWDPVAIDRWLDRKMAADGLADAGNDNDEEARFAALLDARAAELAK